jgi:monothiol glutaredoxin
MTVSIKQLEDLLKATFKNAEIKVEDTVGDLNHFEATVVSDDFVNKTPVQRHKMVYDALGDIVGREVHALSVVAKTKDEVGNSTLSKSDNFKPSIDADHNYANNTVDFSNTDNEIYKKIDEAVKKYDVLLFMKGNKEMPMCGFSSLVVEVLNRLAINFTDIDVLSSEEIREGIKEYSNWPTIPQLYIKGKFIGGADITKGLYLSGELQQILKQNNISYKA